MVKPRIFGWPLDIGGLLLVSAATFFIAIALYEVIRGRFRRAFTTLIGALIASIVVITQGGTIYEGVATVVYFIVVTVLVIVGVRLGGRSSV